MFLDFFSLLYPNICAGCGNNLRRSERAICTVCRFEFPYIKLINSKDNAVTKVFHGRLPIESGYSLISFEKGQRIQNVLHELKYNGNKKVGEELGRMLGGTIKDLGDEIPDTIIPVPLHPKKLKKRGFNQAEIIANGIATVLERPVETSVIKRKTFTNTQTNKSRVDRWSNVEDVFELSKADRVSDKHVLIIDDVLTTGATLEACAATLLKSSVKKISIATAACVV